MAAPQGYIVMAFKVLRSFVSQHKGQIFRFNEGDVIEQIPDDVDWLKAGLISADYVGQTTKKIGAALHSIGSKIDALDGRVNEADPVTEISGIGPATAAKLAEANVATVEDLADAAAAQLAEASGIDVGLIEKWQAAAVAYMRPDGG